jgi:hypothetical protein
VGERIAMYLANQSNELEAQIAACRERITKTLDQRLTYDLDMRFTQDIEAGRA